VKTLASKKAPELAKAASAPSKAVSKIKQTVQKPLALKASTNSKLSGLKRGGPKPLAPSSLTSAKKVIIETPMLRAQIVCSQS